MCNISRWTREQQIIINGRSEVAKGGTAVAVLVYNWFPQVRNWWLRSEVSLNVVSILSLCSGDVFAGCRCRVFVVELVA